MSESIPYADIVILALIAGFILLQLRRVLGQNSGNDGGGFLKPLLPSKAEKEALIVQIGEKLQKVKSKEEADPYLASVDNMTVVAGLNAIKEKDAAFSATDFLEGASRAFDMVFDAFIKGHKDTLKMLLSDALYEHFEGEIDKNAKAENKTETTLVSILSKAITSAELIGTTSRIAVTFTSEQVTVTRNTAGGIVEGNPSELHHIEDHWVFERDVTSKSPNWKIVET